MTVLRPKQECWQRRRLLFLCKLFAIVLAGMGSLQVHHQCSLSSKGGSDYRHLLQDSIETASRQAMRTPSSSSLLSLDALAAELDNLDLQQLKDGMSQGGTRRRIITRKGYSHADNHKMQEAGRGGRGGGHGKQLPGRSRLGLQCFRDGDSDGDGHILEATGNDDLSQFEVVAAKTIAFVRENNGRGRVRMASVIRPLLKYTREEWACASMDTLSELVWALGKARCLLSAPCRPLHILIHHAFGNVIRQFLGLIREGRRAEDIQTSIFPPLLCIPILHCDLEATLTGQRSSVMMMSHQMRPFLHFFPAHRRERRMRWGCSVFTISPCCFGDIALARPYRPKTSVFLWHYARNWL